MRDHLAHLEEGGDRDKQRQDLLERSRIRVSSMLPIETVFEAYLSITERHIVIVDLRRLHGSPRGQNRFDRPYPYTKGDQSNGHEKHKRKPATDGFPIR